METTDAPSVTDASQGCSTLDPVTNISSKPPLAGIYSGRLRNLSERGERAAKSKESVKNTSTKGKCTPSKSKDSTKQFVNCSGSNKPTASPLSDIRSYIKVSNKGDSPAIRKELYSCNNMAGKSPIVSSDGDKSNPPEQPLQSMSASGLSLDTEGIKEVLRSNGVHNIQEAMEQINTRELLAEESALQSDIAELEKVKSRIMVLQEGSVEKMLLEMQLDTKMENIKTRRLLCSMLKRNNMVQSEVSAIRVSYDEFNGPDVNTAINKNATDIISLDTQLQDVRDDLKIMSGIVQKQAMMIDHLQNHNEKRAANSLKHDIIIQGIEFEDSDGESTLKELVTNFLSQTMKIKKKITLLSVRRHFSKGALVITLQNLKDKSVIYKCIKNIIGLKNNREESYYVNDHLTFEGQEEQKRFRYIKRASADIPATDKPTIKLQKGKMYINNNLYTKAIQPPAVQEIICPSSKDKIEKLYQTEGEVIRNGACKFVALSQEIRNVDDVRCGYIKACRKFPDALHIVCSYYLPGYDVAKNQDFSDCKEPGGGRSLLDLMVTNNIVNRAIFVARFYGGVQLGPSRFQSYRDAASSAISRSSYNSITKKNQFPLQKVTGSRQQQNQQHQPNNSPHVDGYAHAASPIPFSANRPEQIRSPLASPSASSNVSTSAWGSTEDWSTTVKNENSRPRADSFPTLASTVADGAFRSFSARNQHQPKLR